MIIGILVEDAGYSKMDFSHPELGNPGVSGTVFEFLMLIRYLEMYYIDGIVKVFHFGENTYPENCNTIQLDSHDQLIMYHNREIDILIVQNGLSILFYNELEEHSINTILWAHNYLRGEDVEKFNSMSNVKRVVFVGREQYDHYVAHDIIEKSIYIYNMFDANQKMYYRYEGLEPIVTYTGSLIPAKGFHMLAHIWKKVLAEVPDAQLNVLGSGKLYDRRAKLGKYGIAEEKYENTFAEFITDENGNILPSVHFFGVVGKEKVDIYHRTMVGVMNPTGISETFGLSGVEMGACGIPVITRKKYGLLDTIENRKTGMLINNEKELLEAILTLLKDKKLNVKLGKNAATFVSERFSPEKIVKQWIQMFEDVEVGCPVVYCRPNTNYYNDWKWLMLINRAFRKICPKFPSLIGWKARRRLKKEKQDI